MVLIVSLASTNFLSIVRSLSRHSRQVYSDNPSDGNIGSCVRSDSLPDRFTVSEFLENGWHVWRVWFPNKTCNNIDCSFCSQIHRKKARTGFATSWSSTFKLFPVSVLMSWCKVQAVFLVCILLPFMYYCWSRDVTVGDTAHA